MKIVLVSSHLGRSSGGIQAWIYHAAEALLALGHEPILVGQQGCIESDAAPPGVRVVVIQNRPGRIPGFKLLEKYKEIQSEFSRLQRELNADIWWIRLGLMAGAAVKNIGVPVVFVHAANYPEYTKMSRQNQIGPLWLKVWDSVRSWIFTRIAYYVERRALRFSTANVYLSASRRQEMADYYGEWVLPKSHVVPPGVDLERFCPSKGERHNEVLRLVSVCRLVKDKNIQMVLRAVAILRDRGYAVQYSVAGEGSYDVELQRLVQELSLGSLVEFSGKVDQVETFYQSGDIFVLPSIYEGFGNVYLEAMACGLPCVALRSQPGRFLVAASEIVEDGQTGRLLAEDNPEELAAVLEDFCMNNFRLKAMKLNARRIVGERYSWTRCASSILSLTNQTMEDEV